MSTDILASAGPGELRLALLERGRAAAFLFDRGEGRDGDIALGRVIRVDAASRMAFVEIGEARPGMVPVAKGMSEGAALVVQIKAPARGHKGAELSAAPVLEGRFVIYSPMRPGLSVSRKLATEERERLRQSLSAMVEEGEGIVLRSAAGKANPADVAEELARLRGMWRAVAAKADASAPPCWLRRPHALARLLEQYEVGGVLVDHPRLLAEAKAWFPAAELVRGDLFAQYGADEALEQALTPVVRCDGGASLLFGVAAGLNVIDVDGGPLGPEDANRAVLPEIARQIRLRNLSGRILVDAVPMRRPEALGRLIAQLKALVAADLVPVHVFGRTPLGAIEMTRERRGPSLAEAMLAEDCLPRRNDTALALEGLRALVAETLARPGARLELALPGVLMTVLRERPQALAEAALDLGGAPRLATDDRIAAFEIREARP